MWIPRKIKDKIKRDRIKYETYRKQLKIEAMHDNIMEGKWRLFEHVC